MRPFPALEAKAILVKRTKTTFGKNDLVVHRDDDGVGLGLLLLPGRLRVPRRVSRVRLLPALPFVQVSR